MAVYKDLKIITNDSVQEKFASYSPKVRKKLEHLRKLILKTASEEPSIEEIEETLKWGEPSYLVKKGSTVRIDWKSKTPEQYAIYFKCTSKLVLTFREVYGDFFNYEKNRAILFSFDDKVPDSALKKCIAAALKYHHVKEQKHLGIIK